MNSVKFLSQLRLAAFGGYAFLIALLCAGSLIAFFSPEESRLFWLGSGMILCSIAGFYFGRNDANDNTPISPIKYSESNGGVSMEADPRFLKPAQFGKLVDGLSGKFNQEILPVSDGKVDSKMNVIPNSADIANADIDEINSTVETVKHRLGLTGASASEIALLDPQRIEEAPKQE